MILSITSCQSGPEWSWKADFYAADHEAQDIYNQDGKSVKCDDPLFDTFACLTYDNIVELEENIEKMRQKHNSLLGFWRLSLSEAIEKRKANGEDVSDLESALELSKQKFHLIDKIK